MEKNNGANEVPAVDYTDLLAQIRNLCLAGMTTDGAEHKQWSLAQILRVAAPETFDTCKRVGIDMGRVS